MQQTAAKTNSSSNETINNNPEMIPANFLGRLSNNVTDKINNVKYGVKQTGRKIGDIPINTKRYIESDEVQVWVTNGAKVLKLSNDVLYAGSRGAMISITGMAGYGFWQLGQTTMEAADGDPEMVKLARMLYVLGGIGMASSVIGVANEYIPTIRDLVVMVFKMVNGEIKSIQKFIYKKG